MPCFGEVTLSVLNAKCTASTVCQIKSRDLGVELRNPDYEPPTHTHFLLQHKIITMNMGHVYEKVKKPKKSNSRPANRNVESNESSPATVQVLPAIIEDTTIESIIQTDQQTDDFIGQWYWIVLIKPALKIQNVGP